MSGRFSPRPTRHVGITTVNGWRLKRYEITLDALRVDDVVLAAADAVLAEALPPGNDGVGFVVIHRGAEQVRLLADRWAGDIVHQDTFFADLDTRTDFRRVQPGGPTACVWELAVHAHERDAYIAHVLDPDGGPDLAGYLDDVLGAPSPVTVPTLETDRLILRALAEHDFEPMADFFADPISRYYGGPCGRDDAWRKFAAYPGHWALRGYGPWAIETKADGAFVGLCGPWYPEGWIEPEITWALIPSQHGHGYATEAAARALGYVSADLGWSTAVSVIAVGNAASAAVAERLGASIETHFDARYGRAALYRHALPIE